MPSRIPGFEYNIRLGGIDFISEEIGMPSLIQGYEYDIFISYRPQR